MFSVEHLFLQSPPRGKKQKRTTMASPAVAPLRPKTNSTGTTSSNSNSNSRRNASLASFPSRRSAGSGSADEDFVNPNKGPRITHLGPRPAQQVGGKRRAAPAGVKSQYPATGAESDRHVEYILVASFDIDRGSVMEHQYPAPVSGDEHMLADLMLPDQAHVRSQDWTVFFLHKDGAPEEEEEEGQNGVSGRKKRRKRRRDGQASAGAEENGGDGEDEDDEEADSEDDENPDGPPLVYVLNLVNTKQDNTVKRGAVVKAMAICTRHSFLHIYKPLLLLALEQYFAHPALDTLAALYNAVNAMDLSLMPRLTYHEKFILQSSDAKDLFLEKFDALLARRMAAENSGNADNGTAPSPRGRFGLPRDTHEFESVVRYANVPVPVKVPVALFPETVGDFSLVKLITTFSKPHSTSPQPFNPTHPHLTTGGPLTHPIIVLLNALLTQKRIIFLGHNQPSSEVAEAVLGACALASGGLLRGFTRHAFPYTDLTKIDDLLKVPGFIAGVTNPAFAHKSEWWDLLCDISTGRMRISAKIEQAPLTEGVAYFQNPQNVNAHSGGSGGSGIAALVGAGSSLSAGLGGNIGSSLPAGADATGDAAFMANVLHAIQERHGENAVRSKFRRWVIKFLRLAAAFEEVVYGATSLYIQYSSNDTNGTAPEDATGHGYVWPTPLSKTLELAANATRIEGWRMTRSYYNFIQDLAAYYVYRPVKEVDLHHLHDKLAKLRLTAEQSAQVYLAICAHVRGDAQITHLLSTILSGTTDLAAPAASGSGGGGAGAQGFQGQHGLFYLALGLFHPHLVVREQVAELLWRIQEHEAGRQLWGGLGRFARMAWERVMLGRSRNGAGGEGEGEELLGGGVGLGVAGAGAGAGGGGGASRGGSGVGSG